jgi:tryptophan halogenase
MSPDGARRAAFPRTVGVLGGGTAGYFAALALKRSFPELEVTVIESSAIPIIGVGEATTTLMPVFLHRHLGLDIVELFRAVRPTFKLGIRFLWGPDPEGFPYPFGNEPTGYSGEVSEDWLARSVWPVESFVHDGNLRGQSLTALLMNDDKGPLIRRSDGSLQSLMPNLKLAYHLDNKPFVAYLTGIAARAGISRVEATIAEVERDGDDVAALRTTDGRRLAHDFFVDASGFRSLLIGGALGSVFDSWAASLFCDRAVVATVPRERGPEPYTTAETMDAGWCWRIPMMHEDHRGYVHASAFLDEDAAIREMRGKNPTMGEPHIVRFRSGRHRDFWRGNVVAVGNAYGFVEPLESTALHMVIVELGLVTDGLRSLRDGADGGDIASRTSATIGAHWDFLRWFLSVHYRFNGRLDTPFWRAARAEVDVSGFAAALENFRQHGPWIDSVADAERPADPTFRSPGLMTMLLGQRAPGSEQSRPSMDAALWRKMLARHRAIADRALSQGDTLAALHAHPELLREFVTSPSSWCATEQMF